MHLIHFYDVLDAVLLQNLIQKEQVMPNFFISEVDKKGLKQTSYTVLCEDLKAAMIHLIQKYHNQPFFSPITFLVVDEKQCVWNIELSQDDFIITSDQSLIPDWKEIIQKTWNSFRKQHKKGWKYVGGGVWLG